MFRKKFRVTFLSITWEPLISGVKLRTIPRHDEFIFFKDRYYSIVNVIHEIENSKRVFIIVEETTKTNKIKVADNQWFKFIFRFIS